MTAPATGPRIVAIGGGKGGVGKSLVAANVGIFLATLGKRAILVDGSFGAPNLHIFAGVPRPRGRSRRRSPRMVRHSPTSRSRRMCRASS